MARTDGEDDPQRLRALFDEALSLPESQREEFLHQHAGDLEARLRELLAAADVPTARLPLRAHPAPTTIGPYRVLEELGEGGMGTVYLAEQREPVRRRVALKLIKLGMDSKAVLLRFESERRALAMMEHSCIARVLDGGVSERGQPYFVMEYVKGVPITTYCDQHQLDLQARISLFQQVCAGVQHAHLKGVMHRDLKPSNVLVTLQDGKPLPKIIDFGLAKATDHHLVEQTLYTERGVMIGTPEYMSPEQAGLGGLDVDTRTDVYSLGVLLYELLVGELPFAGRALRDAGFAEMQRVIREQEPPKPSTRVTTLGDDAARCARARRIDLKELQRSLRGDLDWIVMKALEKDRTRRYETAQELAADLQRHLQFEPVLASPPSVGYRVSRFVRRYRAQCMAAAVMVVALIAGTGTALWGVRVANERAEENARLLEQEQFNNERARIFETVACLTAARAAEAQLHPARPEHIAAMESWIENLGAPLVEALPELEQSLARIRALGMPTTSKARRELDPLFTWNGEDGRWSIAEWANCRARLEGETDPTQRTRLRTMIADLERRMRASELTFERAPDRFVHDVLSDLVQDLGDFVRGGTVERVKTRLARARSVLERSVTSKAALWDQAIRAIADSDGVSASRQYRGLEMVPQLGLVPIGMDPDSKLWEFVHLESAAPDAPVPQRDPVSGKLAITGDTGIVLVLIPPDPDDLAGLPEPMPDNLTYAQRQLTGQGAYLIGKYEVTRAQYDRLASHSSRTTAWGTLPAGDISWFDAYTSLQQSGLTLPTSMQWRRAISAGVARAAWRGLDAAGLAGIENVPVEGQRGRVLPVGSLRPNGWGLYDMAGNLAEWCLEPSSGEGERGEDHLNGESIAVAWRMVAGGSYEEASKCISAVNYPQANRSALLGFRAAGLLQR